MKVYKVGVPGQSELTELDGLNHMRGESSAPTSVDALSYIPVGRGWHEWTIIDGDTMHLYGKNSVVNIYKPPVNITSNDTSNFLRPVAGSNIASAPSGITAMAVNFKGQGPPPHPIVYHVFAGNAYYQVTGTYWNMFDYDDVWIFDAVWTYKGELWGQCSP